MGHPTPWRPPAPPARTHPTTDPRRPEATIRTRRLLAYRARALGRRLVAGSWPARAALFTLALGALAAVGLGVDRLAAADLVALDPRAVEDAVRDRAFWLATIATFIFAYTTFEVFFRASDTRLVGTLPIPGRTRYLDLMSRAVLLHLPLLVPLLAYAAALALRGAPAAGLYAAALFTLVFLVGLPLCVWLHLLAGRTLLTDVSTLRRHLAGGVVADEAALLVYAPAVGLLGTLLLAIAADFALRDALLRGRGDLLAPIALVGLALAALAVAKSRALCDRDLHRILPRFSEFDVSPPFRDDGVRRVVPGERFAARLPATARPAFLRDLRQLRRRFRLDRVLLWLYAAALLRMDLAGDTAAPVAAHLVALAALVGVVLGSAFRLGGRELASPWLERSFPVAARPALLGRLAADAIYPLYALALTAAAPLVAGAPATAAAVLGLGLPLVALLLGASHALAARAYPDRVFAAAVAWRALIIALLGGALWQLG